MTVILAYGNGKKVWMAGDSGAIMRGWRKFSITEKKVFKQNNLLIGFSGSIRVLELIKHFNFEPKEIKVDSDRQYVMNYVNNIEDLLKNYNINLLDEDYDFGMIVGYKGNIYIISPDLSATHIIQNEFSIGDGGDLAFGAFKAFQESSEELGIEQNMLSALAISGQYNMTVSSPFYVLELE